MIKASTIALYLSQDTIVSLDPTPTLSVAIARHLNAIATDIAPNIESLVLPNNPHILDIKVPIVLEATTHELLLRATLSNPSLTLSAAVDGLLGAHLSSVFSKISDDSLILEKTDQTPLLYGCLVPQQKKTEIYWLWRYQNRRGEQRDMYLGKGLDRAVAKVRAIGIPKDARAQRLNKGRKLWAI